MAIISVEGKSLGAELAAWGVPHNYAVAFAEKSTSKNGRIALHPFFFNDTEHMTNPRHWLTERGIKVVASNSDLEMVH